MLTKPGLPAATEYMLEVRDIYDEEGRLAIGGAMFATSISRQFIGLRNSAPEADAKKPFILEMRDVTFKGDPLGGWKVEDTTNGSGYVTPNMFRCYKIFFNNKMHFLIVSKAYPLPGNYLPAMKKGEEKGLWYVPNYYRYGNGSSKIGKANDILSEGVINSTPVMYTKPDERFIYYCSSDIKHWVCITARSKSVGILNRPRLPNIFDSGKMCLGSSYRNLDPNKPFSSECVRFINHMFSAKSNDHLLDTNSTAEHLVFDKDWKKLDSVDYCARGTVLNEPLSELLLNTQVFQ